MNKALHVLVYVFLALAGVALYFELQLDGKRTELTIRNDLEKKALVAISTKTEKTTAKLDQLKGVNIEVDTATLSSVDEESSSDEADLKDLFANSDDVRSVLDELQPEGEAADDGEAASEEPRAKKGAKNGTTYYWMNGEPEKLRDVYIIDSATGKPLIDSVTGAPKYEGSEAQIVLEDLVGGVKKQYERLLTTRKAFKDVWLALKETADDLAGVKKECRERKEIIVGLRKDKKELEEKCDDLDNQVKNLTQEKKELDEKVVGLEADIAAKDNDIFAKQEEIEKHKKTIKQLNELLAKAIQTKGESSVGGGTAVSALPAGVKGKIVKVDNERLFTIVKFSDQAMKEMKGEDLRGPLPALELMILRGDQFVGKIKIRQESSNNLVICDIIKEWEQLKIAEGDDVNAD